MGLLKELRHMRGVYYLREGGDKKFYQLEIVRGHIVMRWVYMFWENKYKFSE